MCIPDLYYDELRFIKGMLFFLFETGNDVFCAMVKMVLVLCYELKRVLQKEGFGLGSYGSALDRMKVYGNRIKVSRLCKGVQDYSNSSLHYRNTVF